MDSTSLELTLNIRKTYTSVTMIRILRHLSEIQDLSRRFFELNKLVHKLEQEIASISSFRHEIPFSMLLLQDALKALKEEENNVRKTMLRMQDLKEKETVVTRMRSIYDFQPGEYHQNQMAILRKEENFPTSPALSLTSVRNKEHLRQIKEVGTNQVCSLFKISDGRGAFKAYVGDNARQRAIDKGKRIVEEHSQRRSHLIGDMRYTQPKVAKVQEVPQYRRQQSVLLQGHHDGASTVMPSPQNKPYMEQMRSSGSQF